MQYSAYIILPVFNHRKKFLAIDSYRRAFYNRSSKYANEVP